MENRHEILSLRSKLSELGWHTLKLWSEEFGYVPGTVIKTINRHWYSGTNPRGDLAKKILSDLEMTLRNGIRRRL